MYKNLEQRLMNQLITNFQFAEPTGNAQSSADTLEDGVSLGRWLWKVLEVPSNPVTLWSHGLRSPPTPQLWGSAVSSSSLSPPELFSSFPPSAFHVHPHSPCHHLQRHQFLQRGISQDFPHWSPAPSHWRDSQTHRMAWAGRNLWDPPVPTPATGRNAFCYEQQVKE